MRNIGSTNTISAYGIPVSGQYSFRGPTGPTGETGSSGTGGFTGNTGNTGSGVIWIEINNPQGLTVHLQGNTKIDVFGGITGGIPVDSEHFARIHTGNSQIRPVTSPQFFLSNEITNWSGNTLQTSVSRHSGTTLQFLNYYGLGGISLYYSGDDLIIHGLTTNSNIGATGSILGAIGASAFGMMNSSGVPVFRYQEIASGITTEHIISGVLHQFIQTKNTNGITNINLTNINGITSYVGDVNNISSNFFYISGNTWANKQYYNTNFSGVTTSLGTTSGYISSNVFNVSNTTTFGKRKIGSCCYCDGGGGKRCLDYVLENHCIDYIDGTFSFAPCSQRRSADCDDWGACCLPGRCTDTTRALCIKFGGIFRNDRLCNNAGACL